MKKNPIFRKKKTHSFCYFFYVYAMHVAVIQ